MYKKTILLVSNLLLSLSVSGQVVDSIYNSLSLTEKIAQLFIFAYGEEQSEATFEKQRNLIKLGVGGVIVQDGRMNPCVEIMNEYNRLAKVPLITSIDGEWGASMRYLEIPAFPRQMQLGALSSDTLIYKMGYLIGKECRMLGLNINYAPDIDINNNPANPVINTRSFGQDREKVARFGAAYMRGMKDAGVAGSAKHFPGHGDTDVDSHKGLPVINHSRARLDSIEFYPFKHLIREGADIVMVGHLCVPALDPSGTISSISRPIITDILKNQLNFRGVVCTDALEMDGLAKNSGLSQDMIPLASFRAGADILLMCKDVEGSIKQIRRAILRGDIPMKTLEEKVKKVLALKQNLGLFDSPIPQIDTTNLKNIVVRDENVALINEICEKTMTMVWDKGSLPIKPSEKVAYIAYGADENSAKMTDALRAFKGSVEIVSVPSEVTESELARLQERFSGYDKIILGIHDAGTKPDNNFNLNNAHFAFFTKWAEKQNVSVVYFGSPYAIDKIANVLNFKAFLVAYANTVYNNAAAARIVLGEIPALGVLPVEISSF